MFSWLKKPGPGPVTYLGHNFCYHSPCGRGIDVVWPFRVEKSLNLRHITPIGHSLVKINLEILRGSYKGNLFTRTLLGKFPDIPFFHLQYPGISPCNLGIPHQNDEVSTWGELYGAWKDRAA